MKLKDVTDENMSPLSLFSAESAAFRFFKMFYITVSRLCGTLMCFYLQHIFLQLCCHILDQRLSCLIWNKMLIIIIIIIISATFITFKMNS